uniref:Thioredoxin domain-containing protein n=1 Tax=Eucampia antarctica TaxID=49252 RepID=A0A7S2VZ97_9STRA|mmetsp:Transcript_13361/g.12958  ORF Transcript_13361/g.12958 Transcript_13361/m.12958 type:complete len:217 (+) Transcript_13361:150-800(+)
MRRAMLFKITLLSLFQTYLFMVTDAFINLQDQTKRIPLQTTTFRNEYIKNRYSRSKIISGSTKSRQRTDFSLSKSTPQPDSTGIYNIANEEQHTAFLEDNTDKIIVLKYYAPWCKGCLRLEPKYVKVSRCKKYENLPILFAQISYQYNEEFVARREIKAIPSMEIYVGKEVVENFICGPKNIDLLKEKIDATIKNNFDPNIRVLQEVIDTNIETTT